MTKEEEVKSVEEIEVNEAENSSENTEMEDFERRFKESEDKYLRALADFENTRKRFEKMQADLAKYAISDFAKELVSVLDIFDKAFLGINKESIEDAQFKNFLFGIELTQKELSKIMNKFNVTKIECLNTKFDANFHESLFAKEDPEKEDGIIIEVIEDGYKIHDRLLRPAKVGIVKNN